MRKSKVIGLLSLLFGIAFVLDSNIGMTGFVINNLGSKVGNLIGMVLIIGGVVLIISRERMPRESALERGLVDSREFLGRFSDAQPDPNKRSIILDSSALFLYPLNVVNALFDEYNVVYVPQSVINEIKNPKLKKLVEKRGIKEMEGYEQYKKDSKDYLELTDKAQMYEKMSPYLESMKKGKADNLSNKELKEISESTEKLRKLAERDRFYIGGSASETLKRTAEYLENNCKVSEADTDVVAMAMYQSSINKHALVGEKDSDIRQAIDFVKKEYPEWNNLMNYIEPYRDSA